MSKVVLPRFSGGFLSVEKMNQAMEALEAAFDNTLSRDGSLPNQMEADLDLSGQNLLNSGESDDPGRVLSFAEMEDYVAAHSSGLVVQDQESQVATAAQTVFNLTTMDYVPGSFNLAVYVEGVRKFAPTDYLETTSTQIVFLSGVTLGHNVEFVKNEYLGTVDLPAHTHTWSQITNLPDFATRWPTYGEVTGKPATFPPDLHDHDAAAIVTGRLADARRGIHVQASQPTATTVGELWFN